MKSGVVADTPDEVIMIIVKMMMEKMMLIVIHDNKHTRVVYSGPL
jgi:hypothetical protein